MDLPCCLHIPPVLSFLLRRLLTASGPFLILFWEHKSILCLNLGDAVCGWLAVTSFSCQVFAVVVVVVVVVFVVVVVIIIIIKTCCVHQ